MRKKMSGLKRLGSQCKRRANRAAKETVYIMLFRTDPPKKGEVFRTSPKRTSLW